MLIAYILWSIFIRPFKNGEQKSFKITELIKAIIEQFSYSKKLLVAIIIGALLVSSFKAVNNPKGVDIVNDMIANTKNLKSMSYSMKKTERINNKFLVQASRIKWNRDPFKVFIYQKFPNDGLKVVYKENENNNKAKIDPNGFPWVKVNLDPLNPKMRKNQHHTLFESGFDYFVEILEHMHLKYGTKMDEMLINKGLIQWNDRWCWVIEMNNPHFKIELYTVENVPESTMTLAKKEHISEYMILEQNNFGNGSAALSPGATIKKPNDYARKMKLLIDRELMVPCFIETFDKTGLFERYELTNIDLDPYYSNNDFRLN